MQTPYSKIISKVQERLSQQFWPIFHTKIMKLKMNRMYFFLSVCITVPTLIFCAYFHSSILPIFPFIGLVGTMFSVVAIAIITDTINSLKLLENTTSFSKDFCNHLSDTSLKTFSTILTDDEMKELFALPLDNMQLNYIKKTIHNMEDLMVEDLFTINKIYKQKTTLYTKGKKTINTFMKNHGLEVLFKKDNEEVEKEIEYDMSKFL